ncbi:MAG TPA: zinc ribbon domain-containing protein [Anaeromyxobacteraceae bacterium]|nr:zinc ribbon domain-containing protein [Anaeromyxobacteraceae bacterium]
MRLEEEDDRAEPGGEPDGKCRACGMQNEDDAKFCDQCGASMAAKPLDEEEDDEGPPSSEPPSSKEPDSDRAQAEGHPPSPERMQAPAKMNATATLAAILGAESESHLAIKTAAIKLRQVADTAAGITGKTDHSEIVGALLAVPHKLARGKRAQDELEKVQAKADATERRSLVKRLLATGFKRERVVEDVISGGRRVETRIRTKYATMDLGALRGLVESMEGDAPKRRRNPFDADPKRAQDAAPGALPSASPRNFTDDEKLRLREHPKVKQLIARSSAMSPEQLVAGLIHSYPADAAAFLAAQNGASS